MAVNDLFYLVKSFPETLFLENVIQWLDLGVREKIIN